MAIRVTLSFSGYMAQNLASSASLLAGNCRGFQECWVRSWVFRSNQKPDLDPAVPVRNYQTQFSRSKHSTAAVKPLPSLYTALTEEILGESCKSPIVLGLISLLKSTAIAIGVSSAPACLGISPFKSGSVMLFFFLQVSKWLPCNESVPVSIMKEVDKGGALCVDDIAEASQLSKKDIGRTGFLSRLLNYCSEDTKAVFTAVTLYLGQYMRTSEASYLSEAYIFYEAILSREYFKEGMFQDLSLANKQLRFVSRFFFNGVLALESARDGAAAAQSAQSLVKRKPIHYFPHSSSAGFLFTAWYFTLFDIDNGSWSIFRVDFHFPKDLESSSGFPITPTRVTPSGLHYFPHSSSVGQPCLRLAAHHTPRDGPMPSSIPLP
ncbi:hypothetical protein ACFX16_006297 [Malus domestica]